MVVDGGCKDAGFQIVWATREVPPNTGRELKKARNMNHSRKLQHAVRKLSECKEVQVIIGQ